MAGVALEKTQKRTISNNNDTFMLTPHKYKVALGHLVPLPTALFLLLFLADVYICTGFDQSSHPARIYASKVCFQFPFNIKHTLVPAFVPRTARNSKVIVELLLSGKYWPRECMSPIIHQASREWVDDLGEVKFEEIQLAQTQPNSPLR